MAVDVRHAHKGAFGSESSPGAARLFEQHSERIQLFCRHVLRNSADAEDAVQTTFLYAHSALERGVVPENEYAWLHTIAKNVCRSQYRSAARHSAVTGVDLDALPGPDRSEDDRRELLVSLGEALSSLPEAQRRALVMREWQGLSSGEIASRLELSAPATYALLTRARRSLARAIAISTQRPTLSLSFGPLLAKLKGMLVGSAAKAATTITVVAGVVVGGVAVDRTIVDRGARAPVLDGSAGSTSVAADQLGPASARPMSSTNWSPSTARADNLVERAGAARHPGATSSADAPPPEVPGVVTTTLSAPDTAAPTPSTPGQERAGGLIKTVVDDPATVGEVVADLTDQLPIPGVELPPLPIDAPIEGGKGPLEDVQPDPPALPVGPPSLP